MFQEGWIREAPNQQMRKIAIQPAFESLVRQTVADNWYQTSPEPTIKITKEVVHVQKWLDVSVLCSVPVTALNLKLQCLFRSLAVWPLNDFERALAVHRHGKNHGAPMMIHGISRPWSVTWWRFWAHGASRAWPCASKSPAAPIAPWTSPLRATLATFTRMCRPWRTGKTGEKPRAEAVGQAKTRRKSMETQGKSMETLHHISFYWWQKPAKKHLFIWPYQICRGCVINRRPNQLG